jgi:transketolase
MSAICNGLFAYGALRPFGATFLNFISYGIGAVRLSALSRFGILYIMTHDSIGLGEDGPTHQPIETLEALRSIPNLNVFRPADGNETTGSYICAMEALHTPSVLALSRQNVPNLEGSSAASVKKGAYILSEHGNGSVLDLIIIGTGTEVSLVVEVGKALALNGKKNSNNQYALPRYLQHSTPRI